MRHLDFDAVAGAALSAAPVSGFINAGSLDLPEDTPDRRISQPAAPEPVLPPGIPAGSIIARHWFGVVDSAPSMGGAG